MQSSRSHVFEVCKIGESDNMQRHFAAVGYGIMLVHSMVISTCRFKDQKATSWKFITSGVSACTICGAANTSCSEFGIGQFVALV